MTRLTTLWHVSLAFLQITWREAFAYPVSFLLGRLGVVFQVFVFAFISKAITGDSSYFAFAIVGMLVAGILEAGLRGLSERLTVEINTGRLEGYLVEPVPPWFLPFGLTVFDLGVRLLASAFMLLIALPLGAHLVLGWALVQSIALTLLGLLAVLSVSIAVAGLQLVAKRANAVMDVYSLSARFFGGVLFPIEVLPGWAQPISLLFPHTYVISSVRGLMTGREQQLTDALAPTTTIAVMLVMVAVLLPLSLWVFLRSIAYGKERGLLAGY